MKLFLPSVNSLAKNARDFVRIMDKKYRWKWRSAAFFGALLMITNAILPLTDQLWQQRAYHLSASTISLVGQTDSTLTKQLTFDQQTQTYWYNKDQVEDNSLNPIEKMQQKSVGASESSNTKTYALEVPADMSKGVTYHDTNSQISFSLVPQFDGMKGRTTQDHLVFPLGDNNQAVYTLKNNGLKEDIIVPKVTSDSMQFEYTLKLPKSLEAKKLPDGSVGIYSADSMLFGDISYSTPDDQKRVEKAREKAEKTNLVFAIPAPIIKAEHDKSIGDARAYFVLDGDTLTVKAENLQGIDVPITIDPSVVVTSTSDFQAGGNNEGMIDYSTSGQLTRGALTGGSNGAWTTGNPLTGIREHAVSVVYNGYMYVAGGSERAAGTNYNTVSYSLLDPSTGAFGTWNTTTAMPTGGHSFGFAAYNGFMYRYGGVVTTIGVSDPVYYASINSDGTLNSWTTGANLPFINYSFGYGVYNGYLYMIGGATSGSSATYKSDVYFAPLNADGSVGTWTATTSLSYTRVSMTANFYNGYVYILGGANTGGFVVDVQYAKLKSDGTIGAWQTTSNFTFARYGHISDVYNGYIYMFGGWRGSSTYMNDVQYAHINADGSLGPWRTSTSFAQVRAYPVGNVYNGYIYTGTGYAGGADFSDMIYAKIDPVGVNSSYATSAAYSTARRGSSSVAYGGYLYVMGGDAGSTPVSTTARILLNSDGTLGTINTTAGVGNRTFFAAFAYNSYMYLIGGCSVALSSCNSSGNSTVVSSAVITSSTGTLGTFNTQAVLPTARFGHSAVVYNGYVFVIGGINNTTYQNTIISAPLLASGSITAWTTVSSTYDLTSNRAAFGAVVNGSYIYISGGCTTGTLASCSSSLNTVQYAKFNETGGFTAGWTNTTSFANARYGHGFAIANGYAYLSGGYDGTTVYADTQYARIDANGSLGTWSTGVAMPAGRWGINTVMYNNTLYTSGGVNGATYSNTVYSSAINNGGLSSSKAWTTDTATVSVMGADWNYGTAFAQDGFMYIMGGYTAGPPIARHADVWYAPISETGTIGTWIPTTSMNINHYQHSMAVFNDYVYVMGGGTGLTTTTAVEYAPILPGGGLGAWTTNSNSLTGSARVFMAAEAYNGYLYVLGGAVSSTHYNEVLYAQVNSNGSTGAWVATTSLPSVRSTLGAVAVNGYMYAIGGRNAAGNINEVLYAPINSNGTLGAWSNTSALVYPSNFIRAYAYNGYIFIMPAVDGAIAIGDRTTATFINADGSLGPWQVSTTRGSIRNLGAAAFYNGLFYTLGGSSGSTNFVDIQYAPTQSIARTARYSKLIDLGGAKNISGLTYNGVLPKGQKAISYRSAGSDGVLSAPGSFSSITSSTCTSSLAGVRYLQVMITLDNSADNSIFADNLGSSAYLTDFTVNYVTGHPDANIRLRHGQTLQTGSLSPLDTCI